MQVLYPANGSSAEIALPDNVELLGYRWNLENLTPASDAERQSQLHYDFSEIAASVAGIYVKASEDFSVTLTYSDSEKTLTKTLHVTLDDSALCPVSLRTALRLHRRLRHIPLTQMWPPMRAVYRLPSASIPL